MTVRQLVEWMSGAGEETCLSAVLSITDSHDRTCVRTRGTAMRSHLSFYEGYEEKCVVVRHYRGEGENRIYHRF
jgi:hypothetical protein